MKRRGLLAVGAVLLISALGVVGWSALSTGGRTLSGTLLVKDMHVRTVGAPCSGARPFLDLHPGAAVTVRDAEEHVVAEGELGDAESVNAYPDFEELDRAPTGCLLTYDVTGVPPSDAYTVEVGDGRTWSVTADELEASDWSFEMEIPS